MRILGIVVEYNPFHYGHLHHLLQSQQITKPAATVAVMSGCFTQRGEPALVDKWIRAQMALENGVDLVVELPVAWAIRSAAYFAEGAVRLLAALGVTDICFGSESGNREALKRAATVLLDESPLFQQVLRAALAEGVSFASAQDQALQAVDPSTPKGLFALPNDTLGIHYILAIMKHQLSITPHTILRRSSYHSSDPNSPIPSAKAVRFAVQEGKAPFGMPSAAAHLLNQAIAADHAPIFWRQFEQPLIYRLRQLEKQQILEFPDAGDGLGERVWRAARRTNVLDELLTLVKTKRFALTRLQRLLTYVLLDLRQGDLELIADSQAPPYVRVLAMNTQNMAIRELLRQAKLPVIFGAGTSEAKDPRVKHCLMVDTAATDCYSLAWKQGSRSGLDWTTPVVTDRSSARC